MNLVLRIYLILWCLCMVVLGSWGLRILPASCTNNELFMDLRILVVSAAVTLTLVTCTTICAKFCYKGDLETGMIFPSLLTSIGILQISMIVRIAIIIGDCTPGQNISGYRNLLGVCGGLTSVPILYGCWRFYKWINPERKERKEKVEDPAEIEAKIRRRQLKIRSLEEKLERAKSTKHAVKYNRRLDRNIAKLEKLEEKWEEIEGDKEFVDEPPVPPVPATKVTSMSKIPIAPPVPAANVPSMSKIPVAPPVRVTRKPSFVSVKRRRKEGAS